MCSAEKIFSSAINKHVPFALCIEFFSYWQMTEGRVHGRSGNAKIDVAGKSSKICAAMRIHGRRIGTFEQTKASAVQITLRIPAFWGTHRRMPIADILSRPWY